MENASKALIIAGAILLSILLISLGIMVYNNAKGTASDTNLDAETAQAFNTKISQYCGKTSNGTSMNSLVDAIAASNGAQKKQAVKHYVKITITATNGVTGTSVTSPDATTSVSYPSFDNSTNYKATYSTDPATGYIDNVTISN